MDGRLARVLGLPSLALFGLVYMLPLTVFTTYGIITQVTGGRLPLAYAVTLLAMVFTARSYARMAAAHPVAGSAYAYALKTFGAATGFLTGWSLLLDYLFLPMVNYLVIGIYLAAAFPAIPAWAFILTAITVVTALNVVGITSVARANLVIIAVQVAFIGTFVALAATSANGTSLTAPFTGDGTAPGAGPVLAGAAVLCLSFLGFDAVSTLSEEAREPTRNVPRAIMIASVLSGMLYIGLSYLAYLAHPASTFTDVDSGALDVMTAAGGRFLVAFFTAAYIAGALGSAITAQASVARILYAMGRDGILPRRVFGHVSPRFSTPAHATLVVSAVSALATVFDLATLASLISFGALVAFSAVNLSVVKHHFLDAPKRSAPRKTTDLLLPLTGFALTVWLWTSLSGLTLATGLCWLAAGVGWLAILTRGFRRPVPVLEMDH